MYFQYKISSNVCVDPTNKKQNEEYIYLPHTFVFPGILRLHLLMKPMIGMVEH